MTITDPFKRKQILRYLSEQLIQFVKFYKERLTHLLEYSVQTFILGLSEVLRIGPGQAGHSLNEG
jgi:hypothetical protein